MSNIKPLPCPFCWETPECLPGSDNPDTTCLTVDCIMHENTQPLDAWNYRTPHSATAVVNKRNSHADAVPLPCPLCEAPQPDPAAHAWTALEGSVQATITHRLLKFHDALVKRGQIPAPQPDDRT